MNLKAAEELLGEDLVMACRREGVALDAIDWDAWIRFNGGQFDSLVWYKVVPSQDQVSFFNIRIPLFAHLIECIESGGEYDSHLNDLDVTVNGFMDSTDFTVETRRTLRQLNLVAIALTKVVETILYNDKADFHEGVRVATSTLNEILIRISRLY